MLNKNIRRAGVAVLALVAVLLAAAPAGAHVTVSSAQAVQGGYAKLTFRVPTESDTASTTKLEVVLPADAPLKSVSLKPVPGWTTAVEKSGETTSKIIWTAADGVGVKPGEFQEFDLSVGPLPKTDQMVFKALQTYSDGTIVRWIETGAGELAHPAPTLKLVAAAAPVAAVQSAAPAPAVPTRSDVSASEIASLVIALGALAVAVLAWRRRPTPA